MCILPLRHCFFSPLVHREYADRPSSISDIVKHVLRFLDHATLRDVNEDLVDKIEHELGRGFFHHLVETLIFHCFVFCFYFRFCL